MHGRYSTIPARQVADLSDWIGDEFHIKLKGIIEEGQAFGNKLRLEREITTILGKNIITILDKVTNFGHQPSPYTILYHMNLGYPLLCENSELIIEPAQTQPRDKTAASGLNEFKKFLKPQAGFQEQVFYHTMKGDSAGKASATKESTTIYD